MWAILFMTLFIAPAWSEVWEKPPYIPDENHLPPETRRIQEQEERPKEKLNKKNVSKEHIYKEKAPKKITPKDP